MLGGGVGGRVRRGPSEADLGEARVSGLGGVGTMGWRAPEGPRWDSLELGLTGLGSWLGNGETLASGRCGRGWWLPGIEELSKGRWKGRAWPNRRDGHECLERGSLLLLGDTL